MTSTVRRNEAWEWLNKNGFAVTGPSPYTGFFSVYEIKEDYYHSPMDDEDLVKFYEERKPQEGRKE